MVYSSLPCPPPCPSCGNFPELGYPQAQRTNLGFMPFGGEGFYGDGGGVMTGWAALTAFT